MSIIPEQIEETKILTFQQALDMAEVLARNALDPILHERLSCAVALVKNGSVLETETPQTWSVDSASTPGRTYRINGHGCSCPDAYYQAPDGRCKHVLAVLLARKTMKLMTEAASQLDAPPEEEVIPQIHTTAPDCEEGRGLKNGIDPRFISMIQGKPFVRFAGLLELAHKRGLQSLTVDWTYNDAELSLAHAVAVFPFGSFAESGDASPANVNKKVAPHFRRCALTRAAARCLRLALGLDMVAVEELAEE